VPPETLRSERESSAPPARRWPRRLGIALAIGLALLVLLRIAAPEVLRRVVESQSHDFIHGRIEIANIDLFLIQGRIELEGLVVHSDSAPDDPFLRVDRLAGDLGWGALMKGRLHIDEVLLDRPEIDVLVDSEGRINWEDLPIETAAPDEEPDPDESGSPLVVYLAGARINQMRLVFSDAREGSTPPIVANLGSFQLAGLDLVDGVPEGDPEAGEDLRWELAKLQLEDWHITVEPAAGEPLSLNLRLQSQGLRGREKRFPIDLQVESDFGQLALEAQVSLDPVALAGTLTWSGLLLPRLLTLAPVEGVTLASAESAGRLELQLQPASDPAGANPGALELEVAGEIGLNAFDLAVEGASPVKAKWKSLDVAIERVSVAPIGGRAREGEGAREQAGAPAEEGAPEGALEVPGGEPGAPEADASSQVAAQPEGPEPSGPVVEVSLASVTLVAPVADFARVTSEGVRDGTAEGAAEPAAAGSGPGPSVRLARLEVREGSLRFEDRTLTPHFKYTVGEFELTAANMAWPERSFDDLEARLTVGGTRPLTLSGSQSSGAGEGPQGRFDLEVSELPLLPFNPYLKTAGVLITQGTVSVRSDVALDGPKYRAKTDLVFDSLSGRSTGKAFASRFGVPLEVAITLLEDPFGEIELSVPIKGDAQKGGLQLAQASATALRRSLTNALATPVSMLATTVLPERDGARLTFTLVPFGAGDASLSSFASDQLGNYAELLSSEGRFHANLWPQLSVGDARLAAPDVDWAAADAGARIGADHPAHPKLVELAEARASAVSSRLQSDHAVSEEKIQITEWDGELVDGPPGLRMGFSDGKLKPGLLRRATDRIKGLF